MTRYLHHQAPTAPGSGSPWRSIRAYLGSFVLALALFVSIAGSLAAQPSGPLIFDYTGPLPVCPGTMTVTAREFYNGFTSDVHFQLYVLDENGVPTWCNLSSCPAYLIDTEPEMVDRIGNTDYYTGARIHIGIANPNTAWIRFRLCFFIHDNLIECQDYTVKNIDATAMSGPTSIPCCSEEPVTYCLDAPEGADSYQWDLPSGWTEISRSGNCITVRPSKGSSGQILGRAHYDECNLNGRPIGLNITRTPCEAAMSSTLIPCGETTGGSVSASMTGGTAPFSYAWTKDGAPFGGNTASLDDLSAGTYAVVITDANGCTAHGRVALDDPTSYPDLDATFSTRAYYNFRLREYCWITIFANVTGGKGPYTFTWPTPHPETLSTYEARTPGTYRVTITDARGCSITRVLTYDDCVWNALAKLGDLSVIPNPTSGAFGIAYSLDSPGDVEFVVSNYVGNPITSRTVSHQTSGSFQENFDISGNPPGPYYVQITPAGATPTTVMVELQ